jgi:RNA polymerase sigma-70 factor (ECF subfamily)
LKQLEQRKRERVLHEAMQKNQYLESKSNSTSAEIETRADQELVRDQLSHLPAKYRVVLVLRHLQEMTYEEMAEILTVPIGTIKTHLFRARNLLRERLEAFEHEWKTKG